MKKLIIPAVAALAYCFCACDSTPKYLEYQGISMGLNAKAFTDSLVKRGLFVDTANHDAAKVMLYKPGTAMRVVVTVQDSLISTVQESYEATYNDSTRNLFKEHYDRMLKELSPHPEMPKNAEDHKEARFQTDEGMVTLILENTYTPQFGILYENKKKE